MGCLLGCFGGAKDRKRRRSAHKTLPSDWVHESCKPRQQSPSPKQLAPQVAESSVAELRENPEQENLGGVRKKVTFNLDVKTYEDPPAPLEEEEEEREALKEEAEDEEKEVIKEEAEAKPSPSLEAYLVNHRYQNCASSDDEDVIDGEEEEYEDSDFDEEEDAIDFEGNKEESYDSYFSLPMEEGKQSFQEVSSPRPLSASSHGTEPALLPKGSARDRSKYVLSVLNPVENISQWKEAKGRAAPPKQTMKENINLMLEMKITFSPEPTFKFKKPEESTASNPITNNCTKPELPVDASLSNWLVSPHNSAKEVPQESNSPRSISSLSREERPILGALTIEDLKQSPVSSSPRRSPSRSPDEIPILGTVGSYWSSENKGVSSSASSRRLGSDSKGIPNTTSKYREDKRVNWHSTPFEARLEKAMNNGAAAKACPRFPPAVC